VSGSADDAFEFLVKHGILDKKYINAAETFTGEVELIELTEDLIVFRHTSDVVEEVTSPYYAAKAYAYSENARKFLALPDTNSAKQLSAYLVPEGTIIVVGKVADQSMDLDFFHRKAIGGGVQVYVPKFSETVELLGNVDDASSVTSLIP
jgi:hypothetical protein